MDYEILPGNGWLTLEEAKLLWNTANKTSGPILEVGCYYGKSTCLLAQLNRPIYAVDPFSNFDTGDMSGEKIYAAFLENLRSRNITNVEIFKQRIEEWEIRFVGFAYLDGDHTYEGSRKQLEVAREANANIICIHDYANDGEGRNIVKALKHSPYRIINVVGRMAACELAH